MSKVGDLRKTVKFPAGAACMNCPAAAHTNPRNTNFIWCAPMEIWVEKDHICIEYFGSGKATKRLSW